MEPTQITNSIGSLFEVWVRIKCHLYQEEMKTLECKDVLSVLFTVLYHLPEVAFIPKRASYTLKASKPFLLLIGVFLLSACMFVRLVL